MPKRFWGEAMPDDQDKQENPLAIKTIATAYDLPPINQTTAI